MIDMFWEDCNDPSLYKHICQPDNFLYLKGKKVIYPSVAEIVMNYIEADENNFRKLKRKPIKNQKIFNIFMQASTLKSIALLKKEM